MPNEHVPEREPHSIRVQTADIWAIQRVLKLNTVLMDSRVTPPVPLFPGKLVNTEYGRAQIPASARLREKLNAALLRILDERLDLLQVPLDYDEAWHLDWLLSADSYQGDGSSILDEHGQRGARRLLTEIARVIYEFEARVATRARRDDGTDLKWDPEMLEGWSGSGGMNDGTTGVR